MHQPAHDEDVDNCGFLFHRAAMIWRVDCSAVAA